MSTFFGKGTYGEGPGNTATGISRNMRYSKRGMSYQGHKPNSRQGKRKKKYANGRRNTVGRSALALQ